MTDKYIKNNGSGNFKVTVPFEINTYSSWSIKTKVVMPSQIDNCVLITTNETNKSNKNNFVLSLSDRHLVLDLSYDGETYAEHQQSPLVLDINKTYYIKLEFNGESYIVSVSIDDTTYENYIAINSYSLLYSNSAYVIFIPEVESTYFNGKLDISSTEISGDNTTLFDGSIVTSSGYYNNGVTITDGVVSNFSDINYIQCNGIELNDNYIKIITRINLSDVTTKQTLIYNGIDSEIYIRAGKVWLFDEVNQNSSLQTNTDYYIGYLYKKNDVTSQYEHSLYYMKDTGFYTSFNDLPDFENFTNSISDNIKKPIYLWNKVGSKILNQNVFKSSIYLGSNKTNYLRGTLDLNNTIISNNIVTCKVTKLGYIPYTKTKVLNQISETISPELSKLEKLVVSAQNTDSQSISNVTVTFDINKLNNNQSYYQVDPNEPNCIYVLPDTEVSFKVNAVGYEEKSETVVVSETVTHTTNYISTLGKLVTLTVNVTDELGADVTSTSQINFTTTSPTSYIISGNQIQVVSGSTVYYNVYNASYKRSPETGNTSVVMGLTDKIESVTLYLYSLTVNSSTSGATVTLSAAGYTTVSGTNTATIKVKNNTRVTWTLHKTGYDDKTDKITVYNSDIVTTKSLAATQVNLTVQPTPSTATVKIYNSGTLIKTGVGTTIATVDYGSNLTYRIEATGCNSYDGSVNNITTNTTKSHTLTVSITIVTTPSNASVTKSSGSGTLSGKTWTANYNATATLTISRDCFASKSISVTALPSNSYSVSLDVSVSKSGNFTETTFTVPTARTLNFNVKGGGSDYYINNFSGTSYHNYLNGGVVTATLNAAANSTIKFRTLLGGSQGAYHGGNGIAVYYNNNLILVAPGSGGGTTVSTINQTSYYVNGGGGYDGGAASNPDPTGTNWYWQNGTSLTGNYNKASKPSGVLCYGQAYQATKCLGGTGYANTTYVQNVQAQNGVNGTSGNSGTDSITITQ